MNFKPSKFIEGTVLVIGLLQGCTTLSIGQNSVPSIKESKDAHLTTDGVIELQGLTLSIRPVNARSPLILWGLIVPIIPSPGVMNGKGEDFRIELQIDPSKERILLNPSKVSITMEGKEIRPKSYMMADRGPIPYRGLFGWKYSMNPMLGAPGHAWRCSHEYVGEERPVEESNQEVSIYEPSCIVLKYPIETPIPKKEFSVLIGRMTKNGEAVNVPPINFTKKTSFWYETHALQ